MGAENGIRRLFRDGFVRFCWVILNRAALTAGQLAVGLAIRAIVSRRRSLLFRCSLPPGYISVIDLKSKKI